VWAELTVQAKKDLPENLEAAFKQRFSSPADIRRAIDATVWQGDYSAEDQIVFAHLSNSRVYLVYRPESRTLKVHIENTYEKSKLRTLRRTIEELATQIERFLKHHGNRMTDLQIVIWAEDDDFQIGTRLSWFGKLKRSVTEHALAKLYVPVAAYVASILLGYKTDAALLNVLIAILAVALWVIIAATFIMNSYEFKEE
jgi:hypothetical protein